MTAVNEPVQNWTEETLNALIAADVQESLRLDYKASAALARSDACKKEISKDISAFANSDGGQIIYGIVEKNHHPYHVDRGVPTEAQISREWIEQVITSTIRPKVPNITIKPISLASGGTAYAIDVPQSTVGPHQANDHRYYKRYNFMSLPMEDYEVRDVLRRATTPSPFLTVNLLRETRGGDENKAIFRVSAGNRSSEPALHYVIKLYLPIVIVAKVHGFTRISDLIHHVGEMREPCAIYIKNHSSASHLPLFKEEIFQVTDFDATISPRSAGYDFAVEISCPGFKEYREGEIHFMGDRTIVDLR